MRFIWNTAVKDWRRRRRNPVEFLIWIGIPLLIGVLIALAFGGRSGPRPQAHVLVADNDESLLSGLLIGALSQEAAGGFVRAEQVDEADGRKRMSKGDADALIVIPEGFSGAILREEPATIQLVTNPSETILPGMVEEALSIFVDGTFYVHRLIGRDLQAFADGPPQGANTFPDSTIMTFGVRINQIVDRLNEHLSPVLVTLAPSVDEDEGVQVSFGFLLLPSILFMALLFMAQGLSEDFWEERSRKTLRRFVSSPQSPLAFLLGKILASAGLIFVVCAVALCVRYAYLELSLATLPLALLWATLSGTMLAATLTLIQMFASSQRAGNIIVMTIIFPLMMLGGSFFPFEMMPGWMRTIGARTPNDWALQRLKAIVLEQARPMDVVVSFAVLIALLGVLLWVCAARMSRTFARG
jgi:ABC-type multidrug transport system permease subunit